MPRKTLVILSVVAAVVVGWVLIVSAGAKAKTRTKARHLDSDLAEVAPPTAILASPTLIQPAALKLPAPPAAVVPPPSQPAPEKPASEAASEDERRSYAAVQFEGQPIDRNWAIETRRTVQAKLDAIKDSSIRVSAIDCRSTLCRFDIHGEDPTGVQGYLRKMIRSDVGAGMVVPGNASGPEVGTVTVYLARAGTPLPEVPVE